MTPFPTALLVYTVVWIILSLIVGKRRRRHNAPPLFGTTILVSLGLLFCYSAGGPGFHHLSDHEIHHSRGLLFLFLAFAFMLHRMESTRYLPSSSRRNFIIVVLAGFIITLMGSLSMHHLSLPLLGEMQLGLIGGALVSVLWILLMVGIVEVLFLIPFVVTLLSLLLGLIALSPYPVHRTVVGDCLSGILVGFALSRIASSLVIGGGGSLQPSERLMVGLLIASATLAMFLKSLTLAGLIVPGFVIIILVVSLLLQNFERSIILRSSPRE